MSNSTSEKIIQQIKPTRKIQVGKFYFIHDGSKTGHPGLVLEANKILNRYLVVKFDINKFGVKTKASRGVKHITKLKHPTEPTILNSYIHNRPMLCKRKDIGIELTRLKLNEDDVPSVSAVAKRNPEFAPSLRK